jgi:hypothetical protein
MKKFWRDLVACIETRVYLGQADLDPMLLKDIGESALWQATLKRHLTALEPRTARVSRP